MFNSSNEGQRGGLFGLWLTKHGIVILPHLSAEGVGLLAPSKQEQQEPHCVACVTASQGHVTAYNNFEASYHCPSIRPLCPPVQLHKIAGQVSA